MSSLQWQTINTANKIVTVKSHRSVVKLVAIQLAFLTITLKVQTFDGEKTRAFNFSGLYIIVIQFQQSEE